jgi:hypothetical protein
MHYDVINDDHYRDVARTLPELASVAKVNFAFPIALGSIRLGVASFAASPEYQFHSPSLSAERKESARASTPLSQVLIRRIDDTSTFRSAGFSLDINVYVIPGCDIVSHPYFAQRAQGRTSFGTHGWSAAVRRRKHLLSSTSVIYKSSAICAVSEFDWTENGKWHL